MVWNLKGELPLVIPPPSNRMKKWSNKGTTQIYRTGWSSFQQDFSRINGLWFHAPFDKNILKLPSSSHTLLYMPVDNKNKIYRITQFSVRSGCPKINSAKVQPKLLLRSAKPAYGSGAGFNLAKLHHPWQPVIYIHCEFSSWTKECSESWCLPYTISFCTLSL